MAHVSSEVFPAGLIAQSNNRVERELTSITQRNDAEKNRKGNKKPLDREKRIARRNETDTTAIHQRYPVLDLEGLFL